MSLADLKVGDEVIVQDLGFGQVRRKVSKAGKTAITAGLDRFDRITGKLIGAHGNNRRIFSLPMWEQQQLRTRFKRSLQDLVELSYKRVHAESEGPPDAQLNEWLDQLYAMHVALLKLPPRA